ncbi:MAG: hypothetical protein AB2653_06890, partial [Candidatus Thiodiazotropha endolucinida]
TAKDLRHIETSLHMIEHDDKFMHSEFGQQVSLTLLGIPQHCLIPLGSAFFFAFSLSDHNKSGWSLI